MRKLWHAGLREGGLLDELTGRALQTLEAPAVLSGEVSPAPAALRLLLRRYAMTGRADLEAALGPALARALDEAGADAHIEVLAGWLAVFVEAAALSQDERLAEAVMALAASVRRQWPATGEVATVMRSIDACLRSSELLSKSGADKDLIAAAIDELERVAGAGYRPGAGIVHRIGEPSSGRRALDDQINTASALLTAYALTGRLPYSMLAEELMQFSRRTWLNLEPGASDIESGASRDVESRASSPEGPEGDHVFIAHCEAATVLCRMAALHGDAAYREAAVIAPDTDYSADAEQLLERLVSTYLDHGGAAAAAYGLALIDWLTLAPGA